MAASAYALKEFGFKTRAVENPVASSVGTSVTKVLNQNPDRIEWLFVNLGSYTVYLAFGPYVSASKGIFVAASGGTATMKVSEDGEAVAYEVWAVAPSGTSAIYVVEFEKAG